VTILCRILEKWEQIAQQGVVVSFLLSYSYIVKVHVDAFRSSFLQCSSKFLGGAYLLVVHHMVKTKSILFLFQFVYLFLK
jgi:hypothetical protein